MKDMGIDMEEGMSANGGVCDDEGTDGVVCGVSATYIKLPKNEVGTLPLAWR